MKSIKTLLRIYDCFFYTIFTDWREKKFRCLKAASSAVKKGRPVFDDRYLNKRCHLECFLFLVLTHTDVQWTTKYSLYYIKLEIKLLASVNRYIDSHEEAGKNHSRPQKSRLSVETYKSQFSAKENRAPRKCSGQTAFILQKKNWKRYSFFLPHWIKSAVLGQFCYKRKNQYITDEYVRWRTLLFIQNTGQHYSHHCIFLAFHFLCFTNIWHGHLFY